MKFLDLFAGIGGFRLGLEQAGHECIGFCEIDKFARASYKAIHNTEGEKEYHDITKITDEQWRELRGTVDIICGGFPCQSFSIAGKRRGFEEARGTLFFEVARAAKQIQPRYLFLENVKGLLSHDKGGTFSAILTTLDELGYDAEWQLLNSKDYGVPQNRERVFIIGHLRGAGGREVFPLGEDGGAPNLQRIQKLGNIRKMGKSQSGDVFDADGLAPTLCSTTTMKDPPKIKVAGMLEKKGSYSIRTTRQVLDSQGISPALDTMTGGGREPKVLVPNVTHENGKREIVHDVRDTFPTILATQNKSGDAQPKVAIPQPKILGTRMDTVDGKRVVTYHLQDISQTLRADPGDREQKVCVPVLTPDRVEKRQNGRRFKEDGEEMFTLTAQDRHGVLIKNNSEGTPCLEANQGDNISLQPKGRGRVRKGYSGTVATAPDAVVVPKFLPGPDGINRTIRNGGANSLTEKHNHDHIFDGLRIRRLTPRECWRLQDFPDWAFDLAREVNSDSQLYKQAGNSVTVSVIKAIAEKLE